MEYDEKAELQNYVLGSLSAHLTESERARIRAEGIRFQDRFRDWVMERARCIRMGEPEPPWRSEECSPGYVEFLGGVVERVLRDLPSGISINRCPECRRVLRTSKAKVCLWCGHSQYGQDDRGEGP